MYLVPGRPLMQQMDILHHTLPPNVTQLPKVLIGSEVVNNLRLSCFCF